MLQQLLWIMYVGIGIQKLLANTRCIKESDETCHLRTKIVFAIYLKTIRYKHYPVSSFGISLANTDSIWPIEKCTRKHRNKEHYLNPILYRKE
ncbi:MAG: hypothetical protein ACMUIP_07995 [bacterium]